MEEGFTTDRGQGFDPATEHATAMLTAREVLTDVLVTVRETVRRNPMLVVGAFAATAILTILLSGMRRRE